jgi:hypothetical protein
MPVRATTVLAFALMLFSLACEHTTSSPNASAPAAETKPVPPLTDQWLGRWPGVEGTYLDLARKGDKYVVTISDLDGPKQFEGVPAGDHIEFVRNGKTESIHHGDGNDAGMKWMLDKKDCLVIHTGEGFCRD